MLRVLDGIKVGNGSDVVADVGVGGSGTVENVGGLDGIKVQDNGIDVVADAGVGGSGTVENVGVLDGIRVHSNGSGVMNSELPSPAVVADAGVGFGVVEDDVNISGTLGICGVVGNFGNEVDNIVEASPVMVATAGLGLMIVVFMLRWLTGRYNIL
ncbi:uncharacterized protein [Rutidosis leptorrhynchoides]|uniref:uncharacterized protein n=1 Tax=Rutidosis leptorrhynchoides TaxID=125765 RepID=UPI003A99A285